MVATAGCEGLVQWHDAGGKTRESPTDLRYDLWGLENVDRWIPWHERVPFEPLKEGLD
jgi:hypothetical protein